MWMCGAIPDLFEALPQQFNVDPMAGAAFVDVVSAMVQFGGQEELQVSTAIKLLLLCSLKFSTRHLPDSSARS